MVTEPASEAITPDSGGAKLIALSGRDKGEVFRLPVDGQLVIGRGESCDLVLRDSEASRRHCTLIAEGGTYRLRDNGSTNGCFVDGEQVSEKVLVSGAKMCLGQSRFVVVLPDDTRPVAVVADEPAVTDAPRTEPEPGAIAAAARGERRPRRRKLLAAAAALCAAVAIAYAWQQGLLPVALGAARVVTVTSSPPGAEIFLNNEYVGLTPHRVELRAGGPHALRLTRRGFQTQRMEIGSDTPATLSMTLPAALSATLLVSASKPDTEVFLDGRFVGKTAADQPLRLEDVRLGHHELRLRRTDYMPWFQEVEVSRTGDLRIYGKLQSRQVHSILNLIAKTPDSALLHNELGHSYMVAKQFDKGMESYRKAFELYYSGKDTSNYGRRLQQEVRKILLGGKAEFNYGTPDEVRVACAKLEDVFLSLAPTYPNARTQLKTLARHYTSHNHRDDAIRLYRKMIAASPADISLYYQVEALCTAENDHEGAINILKQAETKLPKDWALQYRLGQAYLRRARSDLSENDRRRAIEHLEKAMTLCRSATQKGNIQRHLDDANRLKVE